MSLRFIVLVLLGLVISLGSGAVAQVSQGSGISFSPPPGFYRTVQNVQIGYVSAEGPQNVLIRYTLDGSEPTETDPIASPSTIIPLSTNTLIRVKAWINAISSNDPSTAVTQVAIASYSFDFGVVTFLPCPGKYTSAQQIALQAPNSPNAVIRYTLDGTDPTETAPQLPDNGVLLIDGAATIKARAWDPRAGAGDIQTGEYEFFVSQIELDPPPGNVLRESSVFITSDTPGAEFRITGGDSAPTTYSPPLTITSNTVLSITATKSGYASAATTVSYTIQRLARPVFAPFSGIVENDAIVSITSDVPDAVIHYTTDGATPDETSPQYNTPVPVGVGTCLKARAFHSLYQDSYVTSILYRKDPRLSPIPAALTKPHLPHLKFDFLSTEYQPIWLAQPNDGSGRVFVVNSKGSVHAVGQSDPFFSVDAIRANNPVISVTVDSSVVLQPASAVPDFRDLISIAFPPHFESRAYFYVSYHKTDGSVQVEKFTAEESPDRFDPTSRTIIGSVWVPPSGGQLVFGPGGVLYMNRGGPITSAMPQAFFSDPDAVSNKLISILTEPDEDPAPTDNAASWAFAYDWASADQSTRTGLIEYRGPGRRMQGLHVFGTRAGQFGAVTSVNGNLINEILAEPLFSFVPITIAPPPPVFYPFDITALGEDEPGSLYVATYGRPVFFSQTEPPQYQGGVYKVSDTESAFEMAITAAQTGESVSLEWYAAAGWIYQVQRTADFQTWDPVGQPVTGNSEVSTFTDTTPLKVFFYRIAATTSLN